ncbi:MAG: hypothetical protein K0R10_916 [Alphaproteobacteria bacterium]|jgi:hypothetical protein|nr:hypothetical protein [Alphaproteobacteria bacterium]
MKKILLITVICILISISYVVFFAGPKVPEWAGYPADHTALNVFNSFTLSVGYNQRGGAFCLPEEPQQLADALKSKILASLEDQGYKLISGDVSKKSNFERHPLALKIEISVRSTTSSKSASYDLKISRSKFFDLFWNNRDLEKFRSEIFTMPQQEFDLRKSSIPSHVYSKSAVIDCRAVFSPNLAEIADEIFSPIGEIWHPDPMLANKIEAIINERAKTTEPIGVQQR